MVTSKEVVFFESKDFYIFAKEDCEVYENLQGQKSEPILINVEIYLSFRNGGKQYPMFVDEAGWLCYINDNATIEKITECPEEYL